MISINIPCFNRSVMLRECIESFINQTYSNFEIVVVDDGSTEDLTFVKGMDSRVKYIRQEHKGISMAFNLALDNSVGDYIMPFGSDDSATPKLLEAILAHMKRWENKFDVIYTSFWTQRGDGRLHRVIPTHTLDNESAYKAMLVQQYLPHPGSLWKKEIFEKIRYDESLKSGVDWELMLTSLEHGIRFKRLKKKLWIYRTGHEREFGTKRQEECCERILARRGYRFNTITRKGEKI